VYWFKKGWNRDRDVVADIEYNGLGWATMKRQREINAMALIRGGGGGSGRI